MCMAIRVITRTARKTLSRKCEASGALIEKGDRYVDYVGIDEGGNFCTMVLLAICWDILTLGEKDELFYAKEWPEHLYWWKKNQGTPEPIY